MNNLLFVNNNDEINSIVEFSIEDKKYSFDSGISYSEAIVFTDRGVVAVFHSRPSSTSEYVGALFGLDGEKHFDIPFPSLGSQYAHVHSNYCFSYEIEGGLKMVFSTNSVIYRDYWSDYMLDKKCYVASGLHK